MKKAFKTLFCMIIVTIGMFLLTEFSSKSVGFNRSFYGLQSPASGILYYDNLVATASYLCAEHGRTFFNKQKEYVEAQITIVDLGWTATSRRIRLWTGAEGSGNEYNYGRRYRHWMMDLTEEGLSYDDLKKNVLFDPVTLLVAKALQYSGYDKFEDIEKSSYNFSDLVLYTTGLTNYEPAGTVTASNQGVSYVLADCDDNAGVAPRESYVNIAFWQYLGQGGTSAASLDLAARVVPTTEEIYREYIQKLNNGEKLENEELDALVEAAQGGTNEKFLWKVQEAVNNYKEEQNTTTINALKEAINDLLEMLSKQDVADDKATELKQESSDFNSMWDVIRGDDGNGKYEDHIKDNTDFNGVKVTYNAQTKKYLVGPFKMGYIQQYSGGYQFAGMTGTPILSVNEDGRTVSLAKGNGWNFAYDGEYHAYPNPNEEFYISLDYKEGRNKINGIRFYFRYAISEASYSISIGYIDKLAWHFDKPDITLCEDGSKCDGGGYESGETEHTSPKTHYYDHSCADCTGHYINGSTLYHQYKDNEVQLLPRDTNLVLAKCHCGGHTCKGGKKCDHGWYGAHYWEVYLEVYYEKDGQEKIQDIATCHYAWRKYAAVSVGIPSGLEIKVDETTGNGGYGYYISWNIDLTTTMAGNVWAESTPGKGQGTNGSKNGADNNLKDVAVTVYLYQDGEKFGEAIHHKANGEGLSWPIYTDENGYYEINRLEAPGSTRNVNKLFYVVEFAYDGQVFKNTVYMSNANGTVSEIDNVQGTAENYSKDTSQYYNSSMAVETVHDRLAFDMTFGQITGDSAIGKDLKTNGTTVTTNANGEVIRNDARGEINYNGTQETFADTKRVTSKLDSAAQYNGNEFIKNSPVTGNYSRYKMTARTYYDADTDTTDNHGVSTSYNNFRIQYPLGGYSYVMNAYKNGDKRYIGEYMLHINLGLEKRTETDVSLIKDLYKVTLVVNEQKITKQFNGLPLGQPNLGDGSDFLISLEENKKSSSYSLGLYESDLSYQSYTRYGNAISQVQEIKQGTELRVYATYVLRVYNNSETSDVEINEITDYNDATFTLIENEVQTSIVGEDTKRSMQTVAESPYYRVIRNNTSSEDTLWKSTKLENVANVQNGNVTWTQTGTTNGMVVRTMNAIQNQNCRLQTGEYIEVYTTYEIDQAGYNEMTKDIQQNVETVRNALLGEKNNIAEVSNYSTYYSDKDVESNRYHSYKQNNVSGRVDRDSAPNNIDRDNLKNKEVYEDDTYLAKTLNVDMETRSRDMYGYVWEDAKTEGLGQYELTVGNGIYDDGETLVQKVKVSLYEVINLGELNENGGYDETFDGMEYYYKVPADLYYHIEADGTAKDGEATTIQGKIRNFDGDEVEGNYCIGGFLAGDYILRFDYGTTSDGTDQIIINNENKQIDIVKYNGQDYENTRFMAEISDMHLNDKYLDISGATEIDGRGPTNTLRISKARDNESRRMVVDAYSRTIENYRGELLRDRDAASEEFINNTKMFAETPIMQVEIDNPEGVSETELYPDDTSIVEKSSNGINEIEYSIKNIGFGLEERAATDIALEEYITKITLMKADEPLLRVILNEDGSVDREHPDTAYLDKLTYLAHSEQSLSGQGFYSIDVENEFMNDLSLHIEYKIKVINQSEVDFTGNLAGYYKKQDIEDAASGTPTTKLYENIVDGIINLDSISTNSTLAEVLNLYGDTNNTIKNLLNQNISNIDNTDTLRPEVIVYGRYVGRYYYENKLYEAQTDYTITNYSKDSNLASIDIKYSPDNVVKTTVDQIVDYIDVNTSLDLEATTNIEDASWELSKTTNDNIKTVMQNGVTYEGGLLKDLIGLISESAYKTVDIDNGKKVTLYDNKNREYVTDNNSNIALSVNETLGLLDTDKGMWQYSENNKTRSSYNARLTRELPPMNYVGEEKLELYTGEVYITTRKNTSSDADANEMKMDNLAEILVYSNPTGRKDVNSVPGNAMAIATIDGEWLAGYNSNGRRESKLPLENDAWSTEYVSIIPPTGIALHMFIRNNMRIIVMMTIVLTGLVVMFIVKQVKIRKNR